MRDWMGIPLIGLLIAGGVWGKNAIFGSDGKVCDSLREIRAAAVAGGDLGDDQIRDFEWGQVKDASLKRHVETLIEVVDGSAPDFLFRPAFAGALDRCEAIGK